MSCFIEFVNHAQITVPKNSESAAREFYCEFLGLQELPKPAVLLKRGGFWLGLGAMQVHVSLEDGVDRLNTKSHVAYQVRGLREWAEKLKIRGIEVLAGEDIPGFSRFEFRDPFGNRVEFMERLD